MIPGLRKLLESIKSWKEIKRIIPAQIKSVKVTYPVPLQVQYVTPTGLKCLAHASGAVQEVFFVTNDPAALEERLKNMFENHQ
jgi:hypothetical protein